MLVERFITQLLCFSEGIVFSAGTCPLITVLHILFLDAGFLLLCLLTKTADLVHVEDLFPDVRSLLHEVSSNGFQC